MANEFIIKNGFHSKGNSQITGSLSITGISDVSASIAEAAGGTVDLTSGVTGTLPLSNGGLGLNSLAAGSLLVAESSNTISAKTAGASADGKFLKWNNSLSEFQFDTPSSTTPTLDAVTTQGNVTTNAITAGTISGSAFKLNNANALSHTGNVLYVGNANDWTTIELGRQTTDEIHVNGILKAEQLLRAEQSVQITGSLNVSGSTTIEIPTGDAFTILEGDKDQKSRFIFDYTNGDPTFTVASRASTAKIHIRQDATTNGLYLDEDGQIYVNNSTSDGVKINGSCFASIGTNANALDLGSTSRPWNDVHLRSTGGIIISGGTSAQFLKADGSVDSTAYTTNTGTLTGNGVSTRVPFYNGTTSLTTNAAFVYTDGSKRLDLTGIASSGNSPLRLANLQEDDTDSSKALFLASDDDIMWRTLGTNAFTSTTIPTNTNQLTNGSGFLTSLTGAILTSGNQTATGVKTFSGAISSSAGIYLPTGANVGSFASDWFILGDRPKIKVAQNLAILNQNNQQIALFDSNFSSIISGSLTVGGGSALGPTSPILDGRIDAKNDVVAFSTSDKRLKDNITPIDSALDKVSKIQGIEFDWIPTPGVHGNEGHDVGVLAQEVEAVLPEVVTTRDNGYKAVKYEKIVPLLIESIKELKAEIEELKKGK